MLQMAHIRDSLKFNQSAYNKMYLLLYTFNLNSTSTATVSKDITLDVIFYLSYYQLNQHQNIKRILDFDTISQIIELQRYLNKELSMDRLLVFIVRHMTNRVIIKNTRNPRNMQTNNFTSYQTFELSLSSLFQKSNPSYIDK